MVMFDKGRACVTRHAGVDYATADTEEGTPYLSFDRACCRLINSKYCPRTRSRDFVVCLNGTRVTVGDSWSTNQPCRRFELSGRVANGGRDIVEDCPTRVRLFEGGCCCCCFDVSCRRGWIVEGRSRVCMVDTVWQETF